MDEEQERRIEAHQQPIGGYERGRRSEGAPPAPLGVADPIKEELKTLEEEERKKRKTEQEKKRLEEEEEERLYWEQWERDARAREEGWRAEKLAQIDARVARYRERKQAARDRGEAVSDSEPDYVGPEFDEVE